MKLAHFVITRFCLRAPGLFDHLGGMRFGSVDPLERRTVDLRLKLMETTCRPGILSQTAQGFTWVVLADRRLGEGAKARLRRLIGGKARSCLYEYGEPAAHRLEALGWLRHLLADEPDYVLTTLADDDDVLPRRFVEALQSHVFELDGQGRLPPYKIMGGRRADLWDMAFTRDAPLGWAVGSWRGAAPVTASGFSLLCRHPAFDFSVLGMNHRFAEAYFDLARPPPAANVRIHRRRFMEAARGAGVRSVPGGADAFFDAGGEAGAVLLTNHGANLQAWRLRGRGAPGRMKVLGAETFPDVSVDWEAVRRHAGHFGAWRVRCRLLRQKLYGKKGGRVDALHRFGHGIRSSLAR